MRPTLSALEAAAEAATAAKAALDARFAAMIDAAMALAPPGLDARQTADLREDMRVTLREAYWDQVSDLEQAADEADEALGAEQARQMNADYYAEVL